MCVLVCTQIHAEKILEKKWKDELSWTYTVLVLTDLNTRLCHKFSKNFQWSFGRKYTCKILRWLKSRWNVQESIEQFGLVSQLCRGWSCPPPLVVWYCLFFGQGLVMDSLILYSILPVFTLKHKFEYPTAGVTWEMQRCLTSDWCFPPCN